MPWLLNQFHNKVNQIKIIQPNEIKDFIYVDDVVNVYINLIKNLNMFNDEFYEIDVGRNIHITLKKFVIRVKDIYELIYGQINTTLIFNPKDKRRQKAIKSDTKILDKIGWSAKVSLEDGIKETIKKF